MFAVQAALTPDAAAIIHRHRIVRYAELAQQVERLSGSLTALGVGPGVLVAIRLQRTPDMIAVLLAILEAGGAYLPLDLRYPTERTQFVLSDSGAAFLIHDAAAPAPGSERFAGAVLELRDGELMRRAGDAPVSASAPAGLAYVIYTSGSTGTPKGVMLGHDATHLVDWARRTYPAQDLARVAAITSLCFDPSVFEIFVPLCTGGAMVLKENALEPFAADERPTLLDTVPSVLTELCRAEAIPPSVTALNVGGEALRGDLAREVYRRRPGLTLYNHYGPTEATTCATAGRVPRRLTGEPSIGRPARGARILLLDKAGRPVARTETGEIHIGGPGLALGYWNRPELTAERFVGTAEERLYRTGDLACWRDGELHYLGRFDQQVKIRGFRVELGDVEAALLRTVGVDRAVARLRDVAGRSQLTAYVETQAPLEPEQVRDGLAAWLPDYMVPADVVVMSRLPLLVSGKVDIAALPAPQVKPGAASDPDDDGGRRLERPILHVFREVLGCVGVRPTDSFFDLGGDSLSSVRAALRLEEMLGCELPPALIHQAPTARSLARALQHAQVRPDRHISLLQPGAPAAPLFCVADLFGQPFNYLSLGRRLGSDRSIYGVAPGPSQQSFTQDGDVGRLTRAFVDELRRVRPHGPYLIAGYSAGGLLAFDLACALEEAGEAVSLVLLDASLHAARPGFAAVVGWIGRQAWAVVKPRGLALRSRRVAAALARLTRRSLRGTPPDWVPASQVSFAASLIEAGARYRPRRFFGPTLLIRARDADPLDQLYDSDGRLGWSEALGGEVVEATVSGSHHQFMRDPAVAETARAVRRFLLANT
jgi:amino acid adenylation domain-containing protein